MPCSCIRANEILISAIATWPECSGLGEYHCCAQFVRMSPLQFCDPPRGRPACTVPNVMPSLAQTPQMRSAAHIERPLVAASTGLTCCEVWTSASPCHLPGAVPLLGGTCSLRQHVPYFAVWAQFLLSMPLCCRQAENCELLRLGSHASL